MFINRVPNTLLLDQLSADTYDPLLIANVSKVSAGERLVDFLIGGPKLGVTGTIAESYVTEDVPGSVPYLTTKQVKGLFAYAEDCKYITAEADERWAKCRVKHGAILINKSGDVGAAALLSAPHLRHVNTVSDLINISLKCGPESFDPAYLVVYLNSPYAQDQLKRLSGGAIFSHVSIFAVPQVRTYRPHLKVQKYIGDKVRQAERLRAFANRLEANARSNMRSFIPALLPDDFHACPRKVDAKFTSPTSLGAEFGRAQIGHLLFDDALPLKDLIDSCKCGDAIEKSFRVTGTHFYYGASGPIDLHNEYNFDGEYLIVAQDGTIGRACVARGKFWANNHTWILKVNSQYDADAIAVYLNDYYPFWKGMTTGSVVPKVTSENLMSVVVPLGIAKSLEPIGAPLRKAGSAKELSFQLTKTAQRIVEALIERKVTEDELIHAQTRLEQGDDSADRAILSRLYEGGWDATETWPLFPDLDAYYETLRMVEHEPAEVAAK